MGVPTRSEVVRAIRHEVGVRLDHIANPNSRTNEQTVIDGDKNRGWVRPKAIAEELAEPYHQLPQGILRQGESYRRLFRSEVEMQSKLRGYQPYGYHFLI